MNDESMKYKVKYQGKIYRYSNADLVSAMESAINGEGLFSLRDFNVPLDLQVLYLLRRNADFTRWIIRATDSDIDFS